MPISIYPPTLQSTQPAFLYSVPSYTIYFTLQQITSFNDIGHIQIRIVRQSNNRTIVNTDQYPDGTIYKPPGDIRQEGSRYSVDINASELAETWKPGYVYKVQMRFGTTEMFGSVGQFATWKQEQINNQTFSEWSTVMVIKAISEPQPLIKNAEAIRQDVVSTEQTESSLTPLFTGTCTIEEVNKEAEDKFKFDLYEGSEADTENFVETSGWLQHDSVADSADTFRFKHVLTNSGTYTVIYTVITVNGYEIQAAPYTFTATQSYYAELVGAKIRVDDQDIFCRENGCMRIYLTTENPLGGSYVLTRSDERSNYQVWEDLQFFMYINKSFDNTHIYDDFTIESGIKYKYAFQQENAAGLRTTPIYDSGNKYHLVNFEYGYLYHDQVQLKLSFNEKLNTFKHTVLSSKQDTLGDKYPHISKNGYAYYAEFPITGTISFQMDYDQTFFKLEDDGFHYNGELVIPRDKLGEFDSKRTASDGSIETDRVHLTINSNLVDDNIFVERMFREKAEEFLNNYDYKLYRSPTEGNIVVVLTNVSMTPNATVGRMIYDFSATAYEVMDDTLDNLNEFGIIDRGSFQILSSDEITLSLGQIPGLYTNTSDISLMAAKASDSNNIYNMIKQQEEVKTTEGYRMQLERVVSLWIDVYPDTKMVAEITELEAERSKRLDEGLPVDDIDAQIAELQGIVQALSNPAGNFVISINGRNIMVMPNRVYSLREPVYSLQLVRCPCPIIVNYIAELTQVEDLTVGVVQAIDTSRIWGQLAGIFTDTDKVLKTYRYDYKPGELPYRIYNPRPDKTVQYDNLGRVMIDNTSFNAYKTENLYQVIKDETRRQVESIYNIQGGFKQDEQGRWTDGTIYYTFADIIQFDIEADANTILWIGQAADGSDKKKVIIGPTERYTLNPMESLVRYIALDSERPQFCIVNYKCLTTQMRVVRGV